MGNERVLNKKVVLDYIQKIIDVEEAKFDKQDKRFESFIGSEECKTQEDAENFFNAGYLYALNQIYRAIYSEDIFEDDDAESYEQR